MSSADDVRLLEKLLAVYEMTGNKLTDDAKAVLGQLSESYRKELSTRLIQALDQFQKSAGKELQQAGDGLVQTINAKLGELRAAIRQQQTLGSRPAVVTASIIAGAVVLLVGVGGFAGGYYFRVQQTTGEVWDKIAGQTNILARALCPKVERKEPQK